MGHTLPTITGHYDRFLANLSAFRRALRRSDQLALDELLGEIKQHLPAASYAANLIPGLTFLLAALLEEHKQLNRQQVALEDLRRELREESQRLREGFRLELGKERTRTFLEKQHPQREDPD